jgi:ankyrin repeat protein
MGNLPSAEIYASLCGSRGSNTKQIIRQLSPEKAAKVLWVASEKKDFVVIEKLMNEKLRGSRQQVIDTLILIPRDLVLSILWIAAANGNGSVIELALDAAMCDDMATSDSRGMSSGIFWPNAVTIAAENGHKQCLEYFLARSPEVFALNGVKAAYCAARGGKLHCLKMLVEQGHIQCGEFSALGPACTAGHVDCVQYLLEKRFDINQVDRCAENPAPPLVLAAENGQTACVQLLLAGGADDRAVRPKDGSIAMHAAAAGDHIACLKKLLRCGTHPDILMEEGMCATSLYIAAAAGHSASVQVLLEAGADPNKVIFYFGAGLPVTALHAAASSGHASCVDVLLQYGADRTFLVDGLTALQTARQLNHHECVRLLEKVGKNF